MIDKKVDLFDRVFGGVLFVLVVWFLCLVIRSDCQW